MEKVADKIALSSEFLRTASHSHSLPIRVEEEGKRVTKEQTGFVHSISLSSIWSQAGAVQRASLSVLVVGIRQPHVRGRQLQHGIDEAGVLGIAVVIHLGADKVILPLQPVGIVRG